MLDVSIIIVNYNTLKMTDECICGVIKKTSGISYEIILVDNASTDGSKEFFSADSRVRYIYNDENLGFGKANNKGLEIAEGRNVLFLNPDTLLRNNAIKILSDYLDCHSEVGACGGNLFGEDGTPGMSFRRYLPSVYEEVNRLLEYFPDKLIYGKNIKFNYSGKCMEVGFISGADLMVKHSVLDAVGAFNPRFHLYYEETELCLRIRQAGYGIMSVPHSEIIHYVGESTGKDEGLRYCRMEKSRRIFYDLSYSKWYTTIADAIRRLTLFRKKHSPSAKTRKTWKNRKFI